MIKILVSRFGEVRYELEGETKFDAISNFVTESDSDFAASVYREAEMRRDIVSPMVSDEEIGIESFEFMAVVKGYEVSYEGSEE